MAYVISNDCIACGSCIDECPSGAISEGEKYCIDPDLCVECGSCTDVCPCEAISLKNDNTGDPSSRLCPCCQKKIDGEVDNPKLRQGAKAGAKFAAKQGIKLAAGASVPAAAGAAGAAIGSVIPVVGNFLGYVAGYAIGHVAQEMALDAAYDKLEEKYATKKFVYYCPECNLSWNSTETDDRNIIVRNFVEYYEANKKDTPARPATFNSRKYQTPAYILTICTMIIAMLAFVPWFKGGEDGVPYHEFFSYVMPFFSILCMVAIGLAVYLFIAFMDCKEKYNRYKLELEEVVRFNNGLHDDLLGRFNNVISQNTPRLGDKLEELPVARSKETVSSGAEKPTELSQYASVSFIWGILAALGGVVISIILACVLSSNSRKDYLYTSEESETPTDYYNNDYYSDTNASTTMSSAADEGYEMEEAAEMSEDNAVSQEDDYGDDQIICAALENYLMGRPNSVVLTDEARADILESSWPEVQCSVDDILDAPSSFKNLKVKVVGPRKYKYECTCPRHGDKFVDCCTIDAMLNINGEVVIVNHITWD